LTVAAIVPNVRKFLTRTIAVITSKVTSKVQTTITRPVRAALRIGDGDEIAYAIEGNRVVLTKVGAISADDPFALFEEWASESDRRAYAKL
jgi:antitoxin PrlF